MLCQHALAGPSVVAVPLLNILLMPLLGLADVGLLLYAIGDVIQYREDGNYRRPPRQIVGGVLMFGLATTAIVVLWGRIPLRYQPVHGMSLTAVWMIELGIFVEAVARWANRIRVRPAVMLVRAALVGLLFLSIVTLATFFPEIAKSFWIAFSQPTASQIPSDELGTSTLAALLGPLLALGANIVYPKVAVESYLFTRRVGNSLERLLYRATSRGKMVMITLEDGKVYCGYVDWIPGNPGSPDAFLEILPVFSGYRGTESKRVSLPVTYAPFLKKLNSDEWIQFKKVVPVASIATAGEFDPEYFDAFEKRAPVQSTAEPVSDAGVARDSKESSNGSDQVPIADQA